MREPFFPNSLEEISGPNLDGYRIWVGISKTQSNSRLERVNAELEKITGKRFVHTRPGKTKSHLDRIFFLVTHRGSNQVHLQAIMEGNGINQLRRELESGTLLNPPRSFDGNSNTFDDINLYRRTENLKDQVSFIETTVDALVEQLSEALNAAGIIGHEIIVKLQHLEVDWHRVSTNGSEGYLGERKRQMQENFPEVNLGGVKQGGFVRGVKSEVEPGADTVLYMKTPEVVREEIKLSDAFFRRHREGLKGLSIREQIVWAIEKAKSFHSSSYGSIPNTRMIFTAEEALRHFLSNCPRKVASDMVALMRATKGRVKIKSNSPFYYAATRLVERGIIYRCPHTRAVFILSPSLQPMILDAVI